MAGPLAGVRVVEVAGVVSVPMATMVLADQAPCLGEHTAEVLAEIGYDAARIEALRAAGACV